MYCFDLEKVMNTENKSVICPKHKSKRQYSVYYENMFAIDPEDETVIGYCGKSKELVAEDMTQRPVKIDSCNSILNTIIFNQKLGVLLTGYKNGELIQYGKQSDKKWKLQMNYENIKIGSIRSSDQMGCIAVVGGNTKNKGNLRMIHLKEQVLLGSNIETAFQRIHSLCLTSGDQALLSVGGQYPDYSNGKTDIFDITQVFHVQNFNRFCKVGTV